jgi:hypothetical protein
MMLVGIEQEFVFADQDGHYLDADNSDYSLFSTIVDSFPAYPEDETYLECKSLETYPKRCYVEGFERHDNHGRTIETQPKGLEIRTLPHTTVEAVVAEFRQSWHLVMNQASQLGLTPLLTSRHPFKTQLGVHKRLDPVEHRIRTEAQLRVAIGAMFTHGMHVSVSLDHLGLAERQDLVEKVNHYAPVLIPWSFSSPFYAGKLFEGLCARNYMRAHSRSLADLRVRRGAPVLEFRGFDNCGDARLLEAVLRLFCGVVLDDSLTGRARAQDVERLQRSCLLGFADETLRTEALATLDAARRVIDDPEGSFGLLETWLANGDSYALRMKEQFIASGSIMASIAGQYDY